MSVQSIGQAMRSTLRKAHRTGAPVRRNSRERGTFEAEFWRIPVRGQLALLCDAARAYDLQSKRETPGARQGALGQAGVAIIRAMMETIDFASGRLDMSYEWLSAKTGFSRPTIATALSRLKQHGFLEAVRRFVRVAAEGIGPRYKQTSNVYRLALPAVARRLLGLKAVPPPAPVCELERIRAHQVASVAMIKALPTDEYAQALVSDPSLSAALARLARAVSQQTHDSELNQLPQPCTNFIDSEYESEATLCAAATNAESEPEKALDYDEDNPAFSVRNAHQGEHDDPERPKRPPSQMLKPESHDDNDEKLC